MEPSLEQAIAEHLELKRRNSALEVELPLARYLEGPGTDAASAALPEPDQDSWWEQETTTWESAGTFRWGS